MRSVVQLYLGPPGSRGLEREGYGGIAQLEEHLLCKQGVGGSNPLTSTILDVLEIKCSAESEFLISGGSGRLIFDNWNSDG